MYVHSSFAVNQLYDNVTDIELLIISVSPSSHSRPPSSYIDIFDCLSNRLCMLNPYVFNNFVLLGDFNVNFFNTDSYLYSHLTYTFSPFNISSELESNQILWTGS